MDTKLRRREKVWEVQGVSTEQLKEKELDDKDAAKNSRIRENWHEDRFSSNVHEKKVNKSKLKNQFKRCTPSMCEVSLSPFLGDAAQMFYIKYDNGNPICHL